MRFFFWLKQISEVEFGPTTGCPPYYPVNQMFLLIHASCWQCSSWVGSWFQNSREDLDSLNYSSLQSGQWLVHSVRCIWILNCSTVTVFWRMTNITERNCLNGFGFSSSYQSKWNTHQTVTTIPLCFESTVFWSCASCSFSGKNVWSEGAISFNNDIKITSSLSIPLSLYC